MLSSGGAAHSWGSYLQGPTPPLAPPRFCLAGIQNEATVQSSNGGRGFLLLRGKAGIWGRAANEKGTLHAPDLASFLHQQCGLQPRTTAHWSPRQLWSLSFLSIRSTPRQGTRCESPVISLGSGSYKKQQAPLSACLQG